MVVRVRNVVRYVRIGEVENVKEESELIKFKRGWYVLKWMKNIIVKNIFKIFLYVIFIFYKIRDSIIVWFYFVKI